MEKLDDSRIITNIDWYKKNDDYNTLHGISKCDIIWKIEKVFKLYLNLFESKDVDQFKRIKEEHLLTFDREILIIER